MPTRQRLFGALGLLLAVLCWVPARADTFLRLQNGDTIRARLDASSEVDTFQLSPPVGATVRLTVTAAAGGPSLRVRLTDRWTRTIQDDATGRLVRAVVPAGSSQNGFRRVEVSADDGTSTGDYTISASWERTPLVTATVVLVRTTAFTQEMTFSGSRGDVARIAVRPARGSRAQPVLGFLRSSIRRNLGRRRRAVVRLEETGDYDLFLGNQAAFGGAVRVDVTFLPSRRRVDVRGLDIPADTHLIAAEPLRRAASRFALGDVIDTSVKIDGNSISQETASLSGCSVRIPASAVRSDGVVALARAPDIEQPAPGIRAEGPALFVAASDSALDKRSTVVITLEGLWDESPPRVFRRSLDGSVSEVDPSLLVADDFRFRRRVAFESQVPATFQAFEPRTPRAAVDVSASDDRCAIGNEGETVEGHVNAGSARIYARSGGGWSERVLLTSPTPRDEARFGASVSISGDVLAVGAPGTVDEAFVFERDPDLGWTLSATLASPVAGSGFGTDVAVDGDTCVVGAPREGKDGAIYVFVRSATGWTLSQTHRRQVSDLPRGSSSAVARAMKSMSASRRCTWARRASICSSRSGSFTST